MLVHILPGYTRLVRSKAAAQQECNARTELRLQPLRGLYQIAHSFLLNHTCGKYNRNRTVGRLRGIPEIVEIYPRPFGKLHLMRTYNFMLEEQRLVVSILKYNPYTLAIIGEAHDTQYAARNHG